MKKTTQASYYRNGQLRERVPLAKGRRHGAVRTWHRNGVMASEEPFVEGRLHGVGRHWDETGKLLGEFRMEHGTGVQREWHDNGRIKLEVATVAGTLCGPGRLWLRDGTLFSERFYLHGKPVSRAKYAKAAERDPALPRPGDSAVAPRRNSQASQRHAHEVFVRTLLEKSNQAEARTWLGGEARPAVSPSLGRFPSRKQAQSFVEALYAAGALVVTVPGIYRDQKGKEFADWLVAQLPRTKAIRGRIRAACGFLKEKSLGAFLPETDLGESHLFLVLE